MDELKVEPTLSIVAKALEQVASVERIATSSKNLKRTNVKRLNVAIGFLRAGIATLSQRAQAAASNQAADLEILRGEISSLHLEVAGLRAAKERADAELAILRAASPPLGSARRQAPPRTSEGTQTSPHLAPLGSVGGKVGRTRAVGPPAPLPPPASSTEKWSEVVKRRRKAKRSSSAPSAPGVASRFATVERAAQKGGRNGPAEAVPGRRAPGPAGPASGPRGPAGPQPAGPAPRLAKSAGKKRRRKIPRSAAVVLTCLAGKDAEAMTTARGAISLAELGIEKIMPKRALTGALLFELPGVKVDAADRLTSCMREALAGM